MGQSWSNFQRRQNAKTLMELAPFKTPGGDAPIGSLDRQTLEASLKNVAAYIHSKKDNVTVIAVGGAVNTMYLKTRRSTHDVDFFNNSLTTANFKHIVDGAREAAKKDSRLNEEWFNNRTILFIPKDQRNALTQQAFRQREIIFSEPGLTVLAAPWEYAFCCKIDRVAGGGIKGGRSYDIPDAVQYLHQFLGRHRVSHVSKQTVKDWFAQYALKWTTGCETAINTVNTEYKKTFKVNYNAIS